MSTMSQPTAPRSRLDEGSDAYQLALSVANELDAEGLDLWAGNLRACLDATSSTARQRHLALELTRLAQTSGLRRAGLVRKVGEALGALEAGLVDIDLPEQPLYTATRELCDHLELHGAGRWLGRLRAVVADPERTATACLARLEGLLSAMTPDDPGLPLETSAKVAAVVRRLPRPTDAATAVPFLVFAMQRPAPSRHRGDVTRSSE